MLRTGAQQIRQRYISDVAKEASICLDVLCIVESSPVNRSGHVRTRHSHRYERIIHFFQSSLES